LLSSCTFEKTSSITHPPILSIKPVSSATGINVAGNKTPLAGCFHLIRASKQYRTLFLASKTG